MAGIKLISANDYQTSARFFALPKILFESDYYKSMRLDTKVAYSILKDRLALSFKNNWIDEEGYIYLMYSNSNLMKILNCSKSTLLRIKKQLTEFELIQEVQQSTSKSGNLANRIYLGELKDDITSRTLDESEENSFDTRGVSNLDQGGAKKTLGGCQFDTRGVSNSAPSDTKYSDTEYNDIEEEEEKIVVVKNNKIKQIENSPKIKQKVKNVDKYDKDYIWEIVHAELKKMFSESMADYAMIHFDSRYQYAIENMNYASTPEKIAEYVFNGILSIWNNEARKHQ